MKRVSDMHAIVDIIYLPYLCSFPYIVDASVSLVDGWCNKCHCHHIPTSSTKTFSYSTECPKARQFVLPVMLIGTAGTGVGSRIGGHARRGGGMLRKQHIQYSTIGMTNEYRSSQTCIFCFQQIQLARSRRLVGGKVKSVKVRGAVECVNPSCVSFKCSYTIKSRDPHSAVCIAVAGASNLISLQPRETLPPFSRSRPLGNSDNTINASPHALESSSSSSRYPLLDTTRTSTGQVGL